MMYESGKIRNLIHELNYYTELYDKGTPVISDSDWDEMYFHLEALEKETGIVYPDSPTQSIHYKTVNILQKKEHEYQPMLSLDKTKNSDVIQSFVSGHEWLGMFKMDGLTVRLTYANGVLVGAETRGNGEVGENILHNAKVIPSIPKTIPTVDFGSHVYSIDETVIIDGEVICTYPDFEDFKSEYKNPRNFASGSVRLLDSAETASRKLTFVAWDLVKGIDEDFFFWRLEKLDEWGFTTVPRVGDAETIEDAIDILDRMDEHEFYPIDGYVFKFESIKYGKSLGRTDHHWNDAIALKFFDEEYETKLLNIDFDVSRNGILTPVAVFEPVSIDGTEVSRSSLHNISVMQYILGHYPELNQPIWVCKMNQIIPQITKAKKNETPHDHIIFPADQWIPCPICGKSTEVIISDTGVKTLICGNPECEGKLAQRIDHYAGKKGLDIKGLSRKTIEKLIDWGFIDGIKDIYGLDKYAAEWESKTGFGKASVNKILNAINAEGRHPELKSFISALGIPLVGTRISKEIVKYYDTWDDFRAAVGGDWTQFEGFGPEISKAINSFDYTEADEIVAEELAFEQPEVQSKDLEAAAIKDKAFCITGKLAFGSRDKMKEYIESLGGKVTSSVTSKTDYLITNTPNSGTSKNKKAQELNIPIITEEEFFSLAK